MSVFQVLFVSNFCLPFRDQAEAFWKCVQSSEAAEGDDEETSILAAMGCLRTMCTVLDSIHSLPEMFVQLEPTMFPILQKMISEDGQGEDFLPFHLKIVS